MRNSSIFARVNSREPDTIITCTSVSGLSLWLLSVTHAQECMVSSGACLNSMSCMSSLLCHVSFVTSLVIRQFKPQKGTTLSLNIVLIVRLGPLLNFDMAQKQSSFRVTANRLMSYVHYFRFIAVSCYATYSTALLGRRYEEGLWGPFSHEIVLVYYCLLTFIISINVFNYVTQKSLLDDSVLWCHFLITFLVLRGLQWSGSSFRVTAE